MVVNKEESTIRLRTKVIKWKGQLINVMTDYASGMAIVKIQKNGQIYEFKHKGRNATEGLSVLSWSVNRLIDCDIRGILPFEKTAHEYLQIEGSTEPFIEAEEKYFEVLGLTSKSSNMEVIKTYKNYAKEMHPDTFSGLDENLKQDAERKFSELTEAYNAIKKARKF